MTEAKGITKNCGHRPSMETEHPCMMQIHQNAQLYLSIALNELIFSKVSITEKKVLKSDFLPIV